MKEHLTVDDQLVPSFLKEKAARPLRVVIVEKLVVSFLKEVVKAIRLVIAVLPLIDRSPMWDV